MCKVRRISAIPLALSPLFSTSSCLSGRGHSNRTFVDRNPFGARQLLSKSASRYSPCSVRTYHGEKYEASGATSSCISTDGVVGHPRRPRPSRGAQAARCGTSLAHICAANLRATGRFHLAIDVFRGVVHNSIWLCSANSKVAISPPMLVAMRPSSTPRARPSRSSILDTASGRERVRTKPCNVAAL